MMFYIALPTLPAFLHVTAKLCAGVTPQVLCCFQYAIFNYYLTIIPSYILTRIKNIFLRALLYRKAKYYINIFTLYITNNYIMKSKKKPHIFEVFLDFLKIDHTFLAILGHMTPFIPR